MDQFQRTENLIGKDALNKLKASRVAVFGLGGVGSYVAEALARSGVGALELIDSDVVDITNINRQLIADMSTVGMPKTEAEARRIKRISPECELTLHRMMFLPETSETVDFSHLSYAADAIDNITGKLCIIEKSREAGIPVISSMGTGNKLRPELLRTGDIYDTSVCPLARVMRTELRKRGIERLKVVWSPEKPVKSFERNERTPASIAFVPSAAGLLMAAEIIRDIIEYTPEA